MLQDFKVAMRFILERSVTMNSRIDDSAAADRQSRVRPGLRALLGASVCVLSLASLGGASAAEPYRLVPEDKVTLRVVEWRSTEARYEPLEALNGEYKIDDSGNASIPLVGEIKAAGRTASELSTEISAALSKGGGSSMRSFISLEITEHAPVYITGPIKTPGKFPFEVGMTVLKAVSVAGGIETRGDNMFLNYERDRIQAAGALRTASIDQRGLLLRAARLRAEIAGEESFKLPEELEKAENIQSQVDDELNLMRLRQIELASQQEAAKDLNALYDQEIATLQEKIVSQQREITLAEKVLKAGESLASKGLTVNSRQFELERSVADARGGLLDYEIALTKARQALAENARDTARITNTRNAENQLELNQVEIALRKAELDMQVSQLLGNQAGIETERLQIEDRKLSDMEPEFEIVRRNTDGSYATISAYETTELQPHDLVRVKFGLGTPTAGSSTRSPGQRVGQANDPLTPRSSASTDF